MLPNIQGKINSSKAKKENLAQYRYFNYYQPVGRLSASDQRQKLIQFYGVRFIFENATLQIKDYESLSLTLAKQIDLSLRKVVYALSQAQSHSTIYTQQWFSANLFLNIMAMIKVLNETILKPFLMKNDLNEQKIKDMNNWLFSSIQNSLKANIELLINSINAFKIDGIAEQIKNLPNGGAIQSKEECHYRDDPLLKQTVQHQCILYSLKLIQQSSKKQNVRSKISKLMGFITPAFKFQLVQDQQLLQFFHYQSIKQNISSLILEDWKIDDEDLIVLLDYLSQGKEQFYQQQYQKFQNVQKLYSIFSRLIRSLLCLINSPESSTKQRKWAYHTTQGNPIKQDETLNKILYNNLISLKQALQGKEDQQNISYSTKQLRQLRESFFRFQAENFFTEIDYYLPFLNRQIITGKKFIMEALKTSYKFLSKLINLIFKAGIVRDTLQENTHINLLQFNLPTYRTKIFIHSAEQLKKIIEKISFLQRNSQKLAMALKDVRIFSDQLQIQRIVVNILCEAGGQSELEINIVKKGHEFIAFLKDISAGPFGITQELMSFIAKDELFKGAEKKLRLIDYKFNHPNQNLRESTDFNPPKSHDFFSNLQAGCSLGQWLQEHSVNAKQIIQPQKVKYLSITQYNQNQPLIDLTTEEIEKLTNVETLIIHNYKFANGFFSLPRLSKLRKLNLAGNNIKDISLLSLQNTAYQNLQILDLSRNLLTQTFDLQLKGLLGLKQLNLSQNKINHLIISNKKRQEGVYFFMEQYKINQQLIMKQLRKSSSKLAIFSDKLENKIEVFSFGKNMNLQIFLISSSLTTQKYLIIQQFKKQKQVQQAKKQNIQEKRTFNNTVTQISRKKSATITGSLRRVLRNIEQFITQENNYLKNFIVKISNDGEDSNGLLINSSNMIITCAHSVIKIDECKQLMSQDNEQKQKTRKTIINRLRFKLNSSLIKLKCIDFWIPKIYLDNQSCHLDACWIKVQPTDCQLVYRDLKIIYYGSDNLTSFQCLLEGYSLGFIKPSQFHQIHKLQQYLHIDVKNKNIELLQSTLALGSSGSPLISIQVTGAKTSNINILGLFSNTNKLGGNGVIFNQEMKTHFEDKLKQQNIQQNSIGFLQLREFIYRRKHKSQNFNDILNQRKNIICLVKKIFISFRNLQNRYIFIQYPEIQKENLEKEQYFLKKIFIYEFDQASVDNYSIDIRGIKFKNIFLEINQQQKLQDVLKKLQKETSMVLLKIINQILVYTNQDTPIHKYLIKIGLQIQRYMEEQQQPLHSFIQNVLLRLIRDQIQNISLQQVLEKNLHRNQQDQKRAFLFYLNSLQRVQYYSQIIRCETPVAQDSKIFVNQPQKIIINDSMNSIQSPAKPVNLIMQNIINSNRKYTNLLQRYLLQLKQKKHLQSKRKLQGNLQFIYILQIVTDVYLIDDFHVFDSATNCSVYKREAFQAIRRRLEQSLSVQFKFMLPSNIIDKIRQSFKQELAKEFQLFIQIYHSRSAQIQSVSENISLQPINDNDIKSQGEDGNSKLIDQQNSKKHVINSSMILNSNLLTIKVDQNKKCYEDHIGLVLVYNDPKQSNDADWKQYVIGTGVIVGQRTVLTTAFLLSKFLHRQFDYGRIRFRLTNQRQQTAKVIQVRLMTDLNLALLLLQGPSTFKPRMRLTIHNRLSSKSIFRNRKFFCQVIGYPTMLNDYDWLLRKSQGYIFIEEFTDTRFNYGLSTGQGMQGGVIVYFPTGKYSQPHIFGIHTDSAEPVRFNPCHKYYFNEKYNYGKKYIEGSFDHDKTLFSTFVTGDYQDNQPYSRNEKITQLFSVYQNSFIFSEAIFQMNKWKFIKDVNEIWTKRKQIDLYWSIYREIIKYLHYDLLCLKIDPQNMLCFDTDQQQFHPLFDTQLFLEKSQRKGQYLQVKQTFLRTINRYRRRSYAVDIVQPLLALIQRDKIQFKEFTELFQSKVDTIMPSLKGKREQLLTEQLNFKPIMQQVHDIINCKHLGDLIKLMDRMTFVDQEKQKYQTVFELMKPSFKFLQKQSDFQQLYFNDFNRMKEYIISFQNQPKEKEVLKQSIQLIIKKAAVLVTYQLYKFCYKNGIGENGKPFVSLVIGQHTHVWKFFKELYLPKQALTTVKKKYKQQAAKRRKQIGLVERIVNMGRQYRQGLIMKILSWKEHKSRWLEFIKQLKTFQRSSQKQDAQLLKLQISEQYLSKYNKNLNYVSYRLIFVRECQILNELLQQSDLGEKLKITLKDY